MIAGFVIAAILSAAVGAAAFVSGIATPMLAAMTGACVFAVCFSMMMFFKMRAFSTLIERNARELEVYERDISKRLANLESASRRNDGILVEGTLDQEKASLEKNLAQLEKRLWSTEQALLAIGENRNNRPGQEASTPDAESTPAGEVANVIKLDQAAKARQRQSSIASPVPVHLARRTEPAESDKPGEGSGNPVSKTSGFSCPAGKMDIFPVLQPVISLPEENVLFYEAFARTQDKNGQITEAQYFVPELARLGRIGEVDMAMLRSLTGILRRMEREDGQDNPATGLFWNLSLESFASKKTARDFCEILEANAPYCDRFVPEIRMAELAKPSAAVSRLLDRVAGYGYRFSIEVGPGSVTGMNTDGDGIPRPERFAANLVSIAETNPVSHVKICANDLLKHCGEGAERLVDILVPRLEALNVMLIATHVEEEGQVLSLIDHHVGGAQGHFICPPKPVKPTSSDQNTASAG